MSTPSIYSGSDADGRSLGIVTGLDWSTVAMGDPLQESKASAKKRKSTHITVPTSRGTYASVKFGKIDKSLTLYSAALIVSASQDTAFYACELPDGGAWVCWTKGGTPTYESIVAFEARAVRDAYIVHSGSDGYHDAHVFLSHQNMLEVVSQSFVFNDLFDRTDTQALLKPLSASTISTKKLAAAVGFILACGAYYGYSQYQKQQKREALKALQASQQSAESAAKSAEVQSVLQKWYAGRAAPNARNLKTLREALGKLQYKPGNWSVASITCDAKATGWACLAEFKRLNPVANNQSLATALSKEYAVAYKTLTEASATFAVPAAQEPLKAEHLLTVAEHDTKTLNTLQGIDQGFMSATIKPYEKAALPVTKNPDGSVVPTPTNLVLPQLREISLAGPMRNIDTILGKELPVYWSKIAVTFSESASPGLKSSYAMMQLTGVIYAK